MADVQDPPPTTADKANANPIFCRHCGSQFLSAEKATLVEHNESQSHLQSVANTKVAKGDSSAVEVANQFWKVDDMWDFDNYGQSRPISASADVTPETVYVVCADCERGPVGVRWKAGESYYVAHSLVTYEPKEGAPVNGALPAGMSEDFVRQLIAQREAAGGGGADGGAEEAPVVVIEEEAAAAEGSDKQDE